jgi:hypothetical protein
MFYNPFKPHIIQRGDKYLVRQFTLKGFIHMDAKDNHWWHRYSTWYKACLFNSPEEAKETYESRYKTKFIETL